MRYTEFGNTGKKVSILGFGAMRLPQHQVKGKLQVDYEESVRILQQAFKLGVNYVDTAHAYNAGESEIAVGKALKGWRDRVYVATKMPTWNVKQTRDYRRFLEEELERLQVDYIDFYHLHALSDDSFKNTILKYDLLRECRKAKDEGLIKHISFSFHDKPEVMKRIIDVGIFESVLCQYNLLDQSNEEAMAYAKRKGLGVVAMGPIGGGRLASSQVLRQALPQEVKSTPELALRFVFANQNISVALSGMETLAMVEENVKTAEQFRPLSDKELRMVEDFIAQRKKKQEIPCTSCGYCLPCPSDVAIPDIFQLMNDHTVYGLTEHARAGYQKIGVEGEEKKAKADACTECGRCEEQCPQKIGIMERLKEVHPVLASAGEKE